MLLEIMLIRIFLCPPSQPQTPSTLICDAGLADDAIYLAKTDELVTLNISTETGKPIHYLVGIEKLKLNIIPNYGWVSYTAVVGNSGSSGNRPFFLVKM